MKQGSSRKKWVAYLLVAGAVNLFAFLTCSSQAFAINLYDYAINNDGTVTGGVGIIPAGLDASGLGSLTYTVTGAGSHNFIGFFDFEIDEAENTYYNESGSTGGVLATGQSWEVDEPGWVFGDIYNHMLTGTLDNTNSVPTGMEDDVSFALGWDFNLAVGETATITLTLSDILSSDADFYLQHIDTETGLNFDQSVSIYFWSDLTITGATPVAEPGSLALLGMGLGLVFASGAVRRRRNKA